MFLFLHKFISKQISLSSPLSLILFKLSFISPHDAFLSDYVIPILDLMGILTVKDEENTLGNNSCWNGSHSFTNLSADKWNNDDDDEVNHEKMSTILNITKNRNFSLPFLWFYSFCRQMTSKRHLCISSTSRKNQIIKNNGHMPV